MRKESCSVRGGASCNTDRSKSKRQNNGGTRGKEKQKRKSDSIGHRSRERSPITKCGLSAFKDIRKWKEQDNDTTRTLENVNDILTKLLRDLNGADFQFQKGEAIFLGVVDWSSRGKGGG
jgi:hypothetical protein